MTREAFDRGVMREIATRVTLRAGPLPAPGPSERAWAWRDVLHAPPPHERIDGEVAFVVRHGQDEDPPDPEVRVAYATVLRPTDSAFSVEEVVAVEPRVLGRVLAAEQKVTRRIAAGSERPMALVSETGEALGQKLGPVSGKVVTRTASAAVGGVRLAGRATRDALHAVVAAPDRVAAGARAADAHLARPAGRRALVRRLLEPHALRRDEKLAALFLASAALAVLLLAVTAAFALVRPQAAETWQDVLGAFALALASVVALPTFPEFRLKFLAGDVGAPAAIAVLVLGMAVGAWLVLYLGDEIHAGLRKRARPGSKLARALDRAEALANRHGFLAAAVALAIPLGPDTPVFYLLATARVPARAYLLGTIVGCTVRFALWHRFSFWT